MASDPKIRAALETIALALDGQSTLPDADRGCNAVAVVRERVAAVAGDALDDDQMNDLTFEVIRALIDNRML